MRFTNAMQICNENDAPFCGLVAEMDRVKLPCMVVVEALVAHSYATCVRALEPAALITAPKIWSMMMVLLRGSTISKGEALSNLNGPTSTV